ncbi:MAG: DnaJ subfamily C member 13 [Paramarteilia canceri]
MAGDIIMQIKTIKQATYKQFVNIKSTPTPINSLYTDRLGSYSDPQSIISLTETACQISKSDELDLDGREHINLCISCMCLIERCLSNYTILNIYDLRNIVLIVRSASDIQAFSIEFINGRSRNYRCVYRDLLISSLIDAARGVGNTQCTMASFSFKCYRNNLYSLPVDLESEISSIKLLQSLKPGADCEEVLCRFISNISYDGSIDDTESSLFQTSKTKLIIQSINALISFSTTIKAFSLFKVELVMLTLK